MLLDTQETPIVESQAPVATAMTFPTESLAVETRDLHVWFGSKEVLKGISLPIPARGVTALMGPSGCGKTTFLRALNRMHDRTAGARVTGEVLFEGRDILAPDTDVVALRRKLGMIFQKPVAFPKSIFDNVALALRARGGMSASEIADRVELSLKQAALWDEVRDRLKKSALDLSGGQQQRLCIARALAVEPEVLLMDEPASSLDPIATLKIEDLIRDLRQNYTIAIVTHNLQQAGRISQHTGFFLAGSLIEYGPTTEIFERPRDPRTEDFITGRFG